MQATAARREAQKVAARRVRLHDREAVEVEKRAALQLALKSLCHRRPPVGTSIIRALEAVTETVAVVAVQVEAEC